VDLRDLGKVYTADGPFVSIYLSVRRDVEDAAERFDLGWRDVLRRLEDLDVDDATLHALSEARGDHTEGNTRVLIGSHGQLHLREVLPEPLPRSVSEIIRYSPLPHLLPLIEVQSPQLPHIVVLADRIGADILVYRTSGPDAPDVSSIEGTDFHIRKVKAGGWSMRHYQAHAEDHWAHNARNIVDVLARLERDVHPRMIIVGGDVRAVQLIEQHAPAGIQPLLRKIEGARATDGGTGHIADRVLALLAKEWQAGTDALLAKYAEELGQADQAANGLTDTVAALRLAQVDTLLLSDALDADRPLWFGPDPAVVGVTRDDADLGFGEPARAEAVDVLIRAAIGTDAHLRVVTSDDVRTPRDGVGALLRFRLGPDRIAQDHGAGA
jgi:hypothetical protein